MISNVSMMIMLFNVMFGLLMPVGLMIYFRKKYKVKYKAFFIGAAVMFVFAMTLEQIVHVTVLNSAVGGVIKNNIWLLALYGGLMAALFEEGGRYLAIRYVLKNEQDNPRTALMYGAGHGGFEVFVILTLGMMTNLIYASVINSGQSQLISSSLNEEARILLQESIDAMISTPSWQYLLAPLERIAAVSAQIGLSVIVWFAVKEAQNGYKLFLLALGLHASLDFVSAVLSELGLHVIVVELIIYVMAFCIYLISRKVWSGYGAEQAEEM